MGSGQGTSRTWCCRVHFLRTIHPHPLTLSPYVQMLARGLAGALGWIRRPHRGRESRGGHGRGWPATQLPAQVSTGPHEHLLLPLLLIPSMLMAALPQLKSSSDRIGELNYILNAWHISLHFSLPSIHTERQSPGYIKYVLYLLVLSLVLLWAYTTGIVVEVRRSQIILICGCFNVLLAMSLGINVLYPRLSRFLIHELLRHV